MAVDLDPKAVTTNELFGFINPSTREWKDGLFSNIMRELANIQHDGPKWIILDGDIDPVKFLSLLFSLVVKNLKLCKPEIFHTY